MQPHQQLEVFRLLRHMSGHLENVRDDERVLRFCLRATRDFFRADDACLARVRHGEPLAEIVYEVPRDSEWDRALLASFLRAERQGWTDALADAAYARDLTIEGFGADAGLDPAQQLLQAERMADLMVTDVTDENGLLYLGADDIEANMATLTAAGLDVAADDLFTTEILDMV